MRERERERGRDRGKGAADLVFYNNYHSLTVKYVCFMFFCSKV